MPIYEYECKMCGKVFDARQRMSDPPLNACLRCGEQGIQRRISIPTIMVRRRMALDMDAYRQRVDTGASATLPSGPSLRALTWDFSGNHPVLDATLPLDFRHPSIGSLWGKKLAH